MMVPSLVDYLMKNNKNRITIASNIVEDAEEIAFKYPGRCRYALLDVCNFEKTLELVEKHDIAVSFVPPVLHVNIFKA